MEYYRERGEIQADFAQRAGQLLSQYGSLSAKVDPAMRFEATLTVCVLQSLLTIFSETPSDKVAARKQPPFTEAITDIPATWGITRSHVVNDTFPGVMTLERGLEHLRNALCHPTTSATKPPSTSYTSIPSDDKRDIDGFTFTDSPWVDHGSTWRAASKGSRNRAKLETKVATFCKTYPQAGDLGVRVAERPHEKYEIVDSSDTLYLPLAVIQMPFAAVLTLAQNLADYLAKPVHHHYEEAARLAARDIA